MRAAARARHHPRPEAEPGAGAEERTGLGVGGCLVRALLLIFFAFASLIGSCFMFY